MKGGEEFDGGYSVEDLIDEPVGNGAAAKLIIPKAEFLAGFVPPDYLVDGILQRRFIYSMTGQTGSGKTAIALNLACAVASIEPMMFGGHAVERGRVVYFVGENPDDVRARLIGSDSLRSDDPSIDRMHFIVGVFSIEEMLAQLMMEVEKFGGVDLVIIDTSAAYFLGDDENANPQMGAHARKLRSLTKLPGGPCVLPLCHPKKNAGNDPEQLIPRGGGAFLAEVDGNLTVRRDGDVVEFHHSESKFRGPGFEAISFHIERVTTTRLTDTKGRLIPTVHVSAISEAEQAEHAAQMRRDEDKLLIQIMHKSDRSVADLARACNFFLANGEPHKSKTHRLLMRLRDAKLVKLTRGDRWVLTDEGRKTAQAIVNKEDESKCDDTISNRGGATDSKEPFQAKRGERVRDTVPCIHCGQTGDVYKIGDARVKRGHREALHERCAEDWFTGKEYVGGNGGIDLTEPEFFYDDKDYD